MKRRNVQELDMLEQYLKDHGIKYERTDTEPEDGLVADRHQICVPCFGDDYEWDAICHRGSYGAEQGLLEIMGSIVSNDTGDTVEGWLAADDVIRRIEAKMDGVEE